jgi:hypothetical protein
LIHPENEQIALRAEEKGRALARIAVDLRAPYYALVARAYRDEVQRLLGGLSSPPRWT